MSHLEYAPSPPDPDDQSAALPAPVRDHTTDSLPVSPPDMLRTFQFSQGSAGLQSKIFHWMHARDPGLTMTDAQAVDLFRYCLRPVHAYVYNPLLHKTTDVLQEKVSSELNDEINSLQKILNGEPESSSAGALIEQIAKGIITQDQQYVLAPGRSRALPTSGARYNPRMDPHLSHLCYYAMAGNPTGSPLFDEMFDGVREYAIRLTAGDPLYSAVLDISSDYELTHPRPTPSGN